MEGLLVIGAILGLLAIAGGPGLVVFVVRVGFLLVVAFFAFAIYKIEQPPTAAQHEYYCAHHRDPEQCAGEGLLSRTPPDPSRSEIDFSKMPAASPPPAKPGPIRIPLQDLPMPVRPHPQAQGWDVDDTSGPWPADDIKPASARADRLLRRLHESEGLEVGQ